MKGKCRLDQLTAQMAGKVEDKVARDANISVHHIHRIQLGAAVDQKEAQRIADALGVSLATLGQANL
jgi:hypothetical protein